MTVLLAANWKMNLTAAEAQHLADAYRQLADEYQAHNVSFIVCPPALYGAALQQASEDGALNWGGQASHPAEFGAHTGDISAKMLQSGGASFVIAGHSERRQNHGESDEQVAAQIQAAHNAGLTVILCVGEGLADRKADQAENIVTTQLSAALHNITKWESVIIAYEPIWAIGTGEVASPEDIQAMHAKMAEHLTSQCGAAFVPPLLYGGSVNAGNAAEILALPDVNGALIGGASLKIDEMRAIAAHAKAIQSQ